MRGRWPRGPMDKAPDYGSGDSRFESWRGRQLFYSSGVHDHFQRVLPRRSLVLYLLECFSNRVTQTSIDTAKPHQIAVPDRVLKERLLLGGQL